MLQKFAKEVTATICRSLVWNACAYLPLFERLVQPVPGRTGWVRIRVRRSVFTVPNHRWWKKFARGWESDTFRAYRALVRRGDSVVDVGAWIGPTIMFACSAGAARILAIEPNPSCHQYLAALADAVHPMGTELVVCSTGVSRVAGEAEFGMREGGKVIPESTASLAGSGVRIRTARLKDLLTSHDFTEPAFVKIDIEGTEFAIAEQIASLALLPGVRILLSLHPPYVSADRQELLDALRSFDLYDSRLNPISHALVEARVRSSEPKPAWGTAMGNFFELLLVPKGEPLARSSRHATQVASS